MNTSDSDSNSGNRVTEPGGADRRGPHDSWDALLLSHWPNSDGIMAWVLYLLGYAFMVSQDQDSVTEILRILRPIDENLAGLLSSKLDQPR